MVEKQKLTRLTNNVIVSNKQVHISKEYKI
jgi:hypothetical protein